MSVKASALLNIIIPVTGVTAISAGAIATAAIYAPVPEERIPLKNEEKVNFGGKYAWSYNINNTKVRAEFFGRKENERHTNHPISGSGNMLAQCIAYKHKHPDEELKATYTSMYISLQTGVCINPNSRDYGKLKRMESNDISGDYVRVVFLVVLAARAGIKTQLIGQIVGDQITYKGKIMGYVDYLNSHMDDLCEDGVHHVSDFLSFKHCEWTGYGEKAATDLMHFKSCVVSKYLDNDGNEHNGAFWVTSTNLDSITPEGLTTNNGWQTGLIVSDHPQINQCFFNCTDMLMNYCKQEDAARFRVLMQRTNKEQIDKIMAGQPIPADEQIVYLGSDTDPVFEFYITPLAGTPNVWDTKYNPYAKFISQFGKADLNNLLRFSWVTPVDKWNDDSEFTRTMIQLIDQTFYKNGNLGNKLLLSFDTANESEDFNNLKVGQNIGLKNIGELNKKNYIHAKDFTMNFWLDGQQQCITGLNSLNFHRGAAGYQMNTFLMIKENALTHNSAYAVTTDFVTQRIINGIDEVI